MTGAIWANESWGGIGAGMPRRPSFDCVAYVRRFSAFADSIRLEGASFSVFRHSCIPFCYLYLSWCGLSSAGPAFLCVTREIFVMNKENLLFVVIGFLCGAVTGFIFANSINQRDTMMTPGTTAKNSALPADHLSGQNMTGGSLPEVVAAIELAKKERTILRPNSRRRTLH